jgi:hypothetical protein
MQVVLYIYIKFQVKKILIWYLFKKNLIFLVSMHQNNYKKIN